MMKEARMMKEANLRAKWIIKEIHFHVKRLESSKNEARLSVWNITAKIWMEQTGFSIVMMDGKLFNRYVQ